MYTAIAFFAVLVVRIHSNCTVAKVLFILEIPIDGLQSIARESNDKDVVAMLVQLTIETNEESFVIANDVT